MSLKVVTPTLGQPYTSEEVNRAFRVAQTMLRAMREDQTPGDLGLLATIMVAQTGISATVDANAMDEERAMGMVAWFAQMLGDTVLGSLRASAEVRRDQEEKGLS